MTAEDLPAAPLNVLQRLQQSLRAARRAGFEIRSEWLGGETAGWCEFGGKRWIFVDLSLPVIEQIAQIEGALASYQQPEGSAAQQLPKGR